MVEKQNDLLVKRHIDVDALADFLLSDRYWENEAFFHRVIPIADPGNLTEYQRKQTVCIEGVLHIPVFRIRRTENYPLPREGIIFTTSHHWEKRRNDPSHKALRGPGRYSGRFPQ